MLTMNRKLSRALCSTAICGSLALPVAFATGAYAQDQDEDADVEEIIVTGSRIKRRDFEAPNPVTTINAEDIRVSGETDMAKLLRETPALAASLTATGSVATTAGEGFSDDTGIGALNLRALGTNRTLVLVNGRRHVAAQQGVATVDVNTIPIALIERVETVTGGGSAVYGADAVTGVVNFILKDDFEGLDYRAQYGISDQGDASSYFAAVTAGGNFADDRGNAVISVEYTRQSPLLARDRPKIFGEESFTLVSNSAALTQGLGLDPDASNVFIPDFRINFSSAAGILAIREAGTFPSVFTGLLFGDDDFGIIPGVPSLQIFRDGTLRTFDRGFESNPFEVSGGDGIQQRNPAEFITAKFERINVNSLVRYEINDRIEIFGEMKFTQADSKDADSIVFFDDIPIALDNAFIPAALRAQLDAVIANGITPEIVMARDILDEAVQTGPESSRTTFRIVGGLRGDFDSGLSWEVSYNYGRTDVNTEIVNSMVTDRFFAGVDAVVDPDTGETVCRSDLDPSAEPPVSPFPSMKPGFNTFRPGPGSGCIPINLFGDNSITAESGAFAFIRVQDRTRIEQQQVLAVLSGDTAEFLNLPAGPIGFAGGFEYRREESDFLPSGLERSGNLWATFTEAAAAIKGNFDVAEFFGEFRLPIFKDKGLADLLDINGSFRYSDYSTSGGVWTYGINTVWQLNPSIRFRAAYNRAVRSPNVFELFSPTQPAFIGVTADPCNVSNVNAGTEFRIANCDILVGPGFDAGNFLTARQTGTFGGNPGLDPESADTYTVGAVFQPSFIPGLSITVDYYNISIADAIDSLSGAAIAALCVDLPTLNNSFCDAIERDPSRGNAIVGFTSGNVNLSKFSTEGIDFTVEYQHPLGDFGSLKHAIIGTHVINNIDFPDQNDPEASFPREGEFGIPTWMLNYQASWSYDKVGVVYQIRYQNSQLNAGISNEDVVGDPNFASPLNTGNSFVHDISFRWDVREQFSVNAGVNNIGDRIPFIAALTRPVDAIGRTFFLSISGGF